MYRTAECPEHGGQNVVKDVKRLTFDGHELSCGCFLFWGAIDNLPEFRTSEAADAEDQEMHKLLTNIFGVMH